jgi:hypothetical protein
MDNELRTEPATIEENPTQPESENTPSTFSAICNTCGATFEKGSPGAAVQALNLHRRRAHEGLDPNANTRGTTKPKLGRPLGRLDSKPRRPALHGSTETHKQELMKRFPVEKRALIVREWLASGMNSVQYGKKLGLPSWSLRDWKNRYSGPEIAKIKLPKGNNKFYPKPLSHQNGSTPPTEPAPVQLSVPNFCPQCGFSLRDFLMAFTVATTKH